MKAMSQLQGEEREKFVNTLKSQITSCLALDGNTSASERLLINRLKEHWNVNILDVFQKLGVKQLRDLLALYNGKFEIRNDIIYLAKVREDNGVKEVVDMIKNTNQAKREEKGALDKRYCSSSVRPSYPNPYSYVKRGAPPGRRFGGSSIYFQPGRGPMMTSDQINSAAQNIPLANRITGLYPFPPPPLPSNFNGEGYSRPKVTIGQNDLALVQGGPEVKEMGDRIKNANEAIQKVSKAQEIKIEDEEVPHPNFARSHSQLPSNQSDQPFGNQETFSRTKATKGFKNFVQSEVTGVKSMPGSLAYPTDKASTASFNQPGGKAKRDEPDWEEVEAAFIRFLL